MNKPGSEVDDLKGGVAGGSILKGVLKVGHEIEVRPGLVSKDADGKLTCKPIKSRIVSLFAEQVGFYFDVMLQGRFGVLVSGEKLHLFDRCATLDKRGDE